MSRKKTAFLAAGIMAAVLLAALAGLLVLRSDWFAEKLRAAVISAIETGTGGRAEIGSIQADWSRLRIELRQFVLHGTEPAGKPPLIRADSVALGLKVTSWLRRDFDVRYLDVQAPQVNLIVDPGGRTNIPEPKVKRHSEQTAFETLIDFAVGRFSLLNGVFQVEGRTPTPFDLRGRNLGARFVFESAGSRYLGNLSVQPLDLRWDGQTQLPLGVQMAVAIEKNRIGVSSARLSTGGSTLEFSGVVDNLVAPRASFRYQARAAAADLGRLFGIRGLDRGAVQMDGTADWTGVTDYSVSGAFRASGVQYRQLALAFGNARVAGSLRATPKGVDLTGVHLAADVGQAASRVGVESRVATAAWRGRDFVM